MNKCFILSQIIIIPLIIFVYVALFGAETLYALEVPSFPVCSNPQGEVKVRYETGIHGIPGDPNAYSGSDAVYIVDADRTQQCFCSDAGNGIQTNWWRVGSLTQDEIDMLKNLGWHFVPDGSVWGLNPEAYMAFNSTYGCGGGSFSSSTSSNNSSGIVLAAAASTQGSVLGLAATGTLPLMASLMSFGLSSLSLGLVLRKKDKNI